MTYLRLARIPPVALVLLAATALLRAATAAPWQPTLAALDLGDRGRITIGLHLGLVNALLLGLVSVIGAVVAAYSARNLVGQRRLGRYAALETVAVAALSLVVTAASLPLLALGWTTATLAVSALVGHAGTSQARTAARQVRARLLIGDALLWAATLGCGFALHAWDIVDVVRSAAASPGTATVLALLVVGAGVVRSALVPAHRWLPETAEAPSPVSALLHAGLVNGVGVLALLLWPLLLTAPLARAALVVVGGITAAVATAQGRTRADVKGKLAASTSSQMGYLALQAGLGVPAATLAHVLGHGLWKASLFLGAGGAADRARRRGRSTGPIRRGAMAGRIGLAAGAVLAAALVPIAGLPQLSAAPESLALLVAVGCASVALISAAGADLPRSAAVWAGTTVVSLTIGYVVLLRALTRVLAPELGAPQPLGGTALATAVTVAVVVAGLGLWLLDARAKAGTAPALVRRVSASALRPLSLRERLAPRPRVDVDLPSVPAAAADEARSAVGIAAAGIGPLYPLTSFVASNPLSGFESLDFASACLLAEQLWHASPGLGAAELATALRTGRIREAHVGEAVAELLDELGIRTLHLRGRELDAAALLRSLLLEEPTTAEVEGAARALHRSGAAGERELRTPVEALGTAAPAWLDERVRSLSHHYCARSLSGASWTGATGPWAELRADAGLLDAQLGIRGAARFVAGLPADPAAAAAAVLEQLRVERTDRPALLGRLLGRDPGWPAQLGWRARQHELGVAAGLDEPEPDAGRLLLELAAVRLVLEFLSAEGHAPRALGRSLVPDDLVGRTHRPLARLLAAVARFDVDPATLTPDETRQLVRFLAPVTGGRLVSARSTVLERAWRHPLLEALGSEPAAPMASSPALAGRERPAAQLVTCIDVRSERLRRALEGLGPWETFGTAGFFGLPLRHVAADGSTSERAPALLRPALTAVESPRPAVGPLGALPALQSAVATVAATPGLVLGWPEVAGFLTAPWLLLATAYPAGLHRLRRSARGRSAGRGNARFEFLGGADATALAEHAESFLTSMGLDDLAPLVVVAGHGAEVTNNPHAAAYDCGACGGASGEVSALAITQVLNDDGVRDELRRRGRRIPAETRFVAALHNTTTDEVHLIDTESLDEPLTDVVASLTRDLAEAGAATRSERLAVLPGAAASEEPRAAQRRAAAMAADWATPRPEWSLAGAAAIVVGPRSLTRGLDLGGRVFLQSYEPAQDPDGLVLEGLLSAPVVVAQWITAQYWASASDPLRFGAGDKTTHNVLDGSAVSAVMTGARSDLRVGLPWQAVSASAPRTEGGCPWSEPTRHEPMRLLAVVHAAPAVVDGVLMRQPSVARLVSGEWITLCAVDPDDGLVLRRTPSGEWVPELEADEPAEPGAEDEAEEGVAA